MAAQAALLLLAYAFLAASLLLAWAAGPTRPPPRLPPAPPEAKLPRVSIIVPARDEAHNLPRLLDSLLALDYPDFEVLVADGGSADATREVARAYAARDARVRLLEEPPLPQGWIGKSWACWSARAVASGERLLFTDADTEHEPDSLRRAVAHAERERAALLTGLTRQELRTLWERVAMPPVFTLIHAAAGGPGPERIRDPDLAIANGQYLLFDAAAYDALGGHAAVRGSVVEDLALARLAARAGAHAVFVDLEDAVRVRMYRGLREMFVGWRKNVATGAAHTPPLPYLLTVLTFATGLFALPVTLALALAGAWPAAVPAGAAALLVAQRVRHAHLGAEGPGWRHALLHPLGYGFFALVLAASAFDRVSGRGPVWKGRRYHRGH